MYRRARSASRNFGQFDVGLRCRVPRRDGYVACAGGSVRLGSVTALVGRNESGKTNLLRALQSLNPLGGMKPLHSAKDFPRDRLRSEYSDDLTVGLGDFVG